MTTHTKAKSLAKVLDHAIHGKLVEPQQRMVGGRLGYATHRFPIKGGISLRDMMAESICEHNALLRRLSER